MSISVINASSRDVGFSEQELKDQCDQCREDKSKNYSSKFCHDPITYGALDKFQLYQTSDDGKCYNKDTYKELLLPTMKNPYTGAKLVNLVPLNDEQKHNIKLFLDESQAIKNQWADWRNKSSREIKELKKKENECLSRLQKYLTANVKIFLKETILELFLNPEPYISLARVLLTTVVHATHFDVEFLKAVTMDSYLFMEYFEGTVRFIRDEDQLKSIINAIGSSSIDQENVWYQKTLGDIWDRRRQWVRWRL